MQDVQGHGKEGTMSMGNPVDIAGSSHRLLKRGEIKQAGDEWKYLGDKEWKLVVCIDDEFRDSEPGYRFVRRKLVEVEP